MFVRNFLTAGDFMEIVPIGLPLTLKYDERGALCAVLSGYTEFGDNLSDSLLYPMLNHTKSVPNTISIKEGTTFVSGVLYTGKTFNNVGELPKWVESSILADYAINPTDYNFFAATVVSHAVVFRGSTNIRNF